MNDGKNQLLANWILPHSRVLDLACGDGNVLDYLLLHRKVQGVGLEVDLKNVLSCVDKGISAIHYDLNDTLDWLEDASFDYVIMTEAIQVLKRPDSVLQNMVRIGKNVIVTFPNFAHLSCSLQLLSGRMPVNPSLPNPWYNTENIHLCTFADFETLCQQSNITIEQRLCLNNYYQQTFLSKKFPTWAANIAWYMVRKNKL